MQDNSLPSVSYKIQFPDMVTKDVIRMPGLASVTIRVIRTLSGNSSLLPSVPWEQELTNVAYGTNTIHLNATIKEMFDTAQPGDRFDVQIVGKYEYPGLPSYEKSYPDTPYVYVPKPITPNLVVTSPINKDTSVSGFSLLDYITTDSPGALSFSVAPPSYDEPNFAPGIAIDSNGYVTIYVEGTTNILVTQAASADGVYAPATASIELVVSVPLPLTLASFNFDSNGNDASTNNNHLTNYNSVTFNTVDFKRGTGAASFNGSNYFEIANDGRFSSDNLSITFWVKPKATSVTHQSIASCRNMTNVNTGWMIYIVYGSLLNFVVGNGSNSFNGVICDIGTFINKWVHVAITLNKSSGACLLYINGTLFSTNTLSYANNTGTNMRIGAGTNESSAGMFLVNGTLLDAFQFYNATLSASEISSIYAE